MITCVDGGFFDAFFICGLAESKTEIQPREKLSVASRKLSEFK